MESIFTSNNTNQLSAYKFSLSSGSNFSYLSTSSGFDSDFCDITSDTELIEINKNDSLGSFESLMDSDFYGNNIESFDSTQSQSFQCFQFFPEQQQEYLSVFESNQLNSNQITQLWQFLLEILEDKKYANLIRWSPISTLTNENDLHNSYKINDNEFVIYDNRELARLWGIRRNKPSMNHKKFNRILRHYYNKKNILKKPAGKRNTYYFQINIQPYLQFIKLEQDKLNRKQHQPMQFF